MTVKKLKRIIQNLPDNLQIRIEQTGSGFTTTKPTWANVSRVSINSKKGKRKVTCLLITDDDLPF